MSERRIRIAIDAMGGDSGPDVVLRGAVEAARSSDGAFDALLVGDEETIWGGLERLRPPEELPLFVVHARESVGMGEKAQMAFRTKRDSSIAVCASLVKRGRADAFVSAGNTAAVVATSLLSMGRMKGIRRPAIATVIPTSHGQCVILDVGANADCKPVDLYQFAHMGRIYAELVLGMEKPRVGLLNIGEEATKGNALTQAAYKLMERAAEDLNFIGNVEGRDIFGGKADVVVCDGFTGNVILKLAESIASFGARLIAKEVRRSVLFRLGALLMMPAFSGARRRMNYEEYGGALLLGTRGVCVIGHGKSSPRAIRNAVSLAVRSVRTNLESAIMAVVERGDPLVPVGATT